MDSIIGGGAIDSVIGGDAINSVIGRGHPMI